jgi:hypothetical protein
VQPRSYSSHKYVNMLKILLCSNCEELSLTSYLLQSFIYWLISSSLFLLLFICLFLPCREQVCLIPEPASRKKAKLDPFADLRDGSGASGTTQSQSSAAGVCQLSCEDELSRYKALRVPAASNGPLEFWKQYCDQYPIMSMVARRVFCISASSAQSERDFSSVGHTITDMRSRLSASKVESIELLRWGMRAGLLKNSCCQ